MDNFWHEIFMVGLISKDIKIVIVILFKVHSMLHLI